MGNLCSIFHTRFSNLVKITSSTRKAQLVDYILLGWQSSVYKLKGSDKKWFMRPYADIVTDTTIPPSTLMRYLKELEDEGFIVRRQALYSRNSEKGVFEVKKGSYIFVTDKLLALLNPPKAPQQTKPCEENNDIHNPNDNTLPEDQPTQEELQEESPNIDINESFDPLKMRGLYISDLYGSSLNNTISFKKSIKNVDKTLLANLVQQFESVQQFLFKDIKEEIPEVVKKLIAGTFYNLSFVHHKQFTPPKQIVAEYLYALLNVEFYMPKVTCLKHRNNILSKILRTNKWKTPKGFYNHFYLGQDFKDKQALRDQQLQMQKEEELNPVTQSYEEVIEDERLAEIEAQLLEKNLLIDSLTQSIYQQSREDVVLEIREQIKSLKQDIETLWTQQSRIEQEIQNNQWFNKTKRCA